MRKQIYLYSIMFLEFLKDVFAKSPVKTHETPCIIVLRTTTFIIMWHVTIQIYENSGKYIPAYEYK